MQANDQRSNSLDASMKKLETQLSQIMDVLLKHEKGKLPINNEHIKVLETFEGEFERMKEEEAILKSVRVLEDAIEVNREDLIKATRGVEQMKRENIPLKLEDPVYVVSRKLFFSYGGRSVEFYVERPKERVNDEGCFVLEVPWCKKKRNKVCDMVKAFEMASEIEEGHQDCIKEQESMELEEVYFDKEVLEDVATEYEL
ncbi:hypothetical protein Q3G72_024631 [Acer saccharum]|nr:hypothetical protein Q3G72_024631 [Acer saccharum]